MTDLVAGISGGIDAFDRLLAKYPTIGKENANHIRDLIAAGRSEEAQIEILRRLGEEYSKARTEKLTPLDKSIEKLRTTWNGFLDRLGESSAFNTLISNLTRLVDAVDKGIKSVDDFIKTLDNDKVQTTLKIIGTYLRIITFPTRTAAGLIGSAAGAVADFYTDKTLTTPTPGAEGTRFTAPGPCAGRRDRRSIEEPASRL
jgi:phage tail tape-measure protein